MMSFRSFSPAHRLLAVGTALVGWVLAGCGSQPPANRPAPVPTLAPLPLPDQGTQQPELTRAWVARVLQAHQSVRAYEAQLAFYQKSGSKEIRGLYDLRGKQPRLLRIHILEGGSKGTKLLWQGGNTLKVRAAGLLGAIPIDLSMTDKRVVSIRGYTLAQTDLQSLLSMLSHPQAQTRFLGEQGGFGFLEVRGPHLLPGCLSMRVRIDTRTGFARSIDMSDAREVVVRMDIRTFRPVADVSLDI
ncbi:MAG: hypothetical protein VKO21_02465 [Candidatus Sericytochromatia bacterium]|nr:hypothetical protein [Candidatus Sericytochromatia bacterium]